MVFFLIIFLIRGLINTEENRASIKVNKLMTNRKNLLKTVTIFTVSLLVRSFAQMTNLINSSLTVHYDGNSNSGYEPELAIDGNAKNKFRANRN